MNLTFLPHIPLRKDDVVSLVGSGGKTTLMFLIARELIEIGMRVITTTTTKIFSPYPSQSSRVLISDHEETLLKHAGKILKKEPHLTLAEKNLGSKLKGFSPEVVDKLKKKKIADVILIEADGARGCPLKAPNETEPVIPSSTNWVLALAGLDGIGKINSPEYVFRPEYFARLSGLKTGGIITPESLARVILHPQGITKGTPEKARIGVILNKGEITDGLKLGKEVGNIIVKARKKSIKKVLITSLIPSPQIMMVFHSGFTNNGQPITDSEQ